jgi:hypothetical protein
LLFLFFKFFTVRKMKGRTKRTSSSSSSTFSSFLLFWWTSFFRARLLWFLTGFRVFRKSKLSEWLFSSCSPLTPIFE